MADKTLETLIFDDMYRNQCAWSCTITYNNEAKTVAYPLTCEFNIERGTLSMAKHCTLNIYNLSASNRLSEHFRQDKVLDYGKVKLIEFSAGYNGNLVTCFRGIINEAYTTRRNTDIITTIQSTDAGVSSINMKPLSVTFKKGTTFTDAFYYVADRMQYVKPTLRGVLEGEFKTDTTLYGTPLQILNQITNNHTFTDNSQIKMLNNNECTDDETLILSAETGLIDMPLVRNNWITAKMLFNPNVNMCQRVQINSKAVQGLYKVYNINHQGTISGAICGQRITTIGMILGDKLQNSEENITKQTERQGLKIVKGTEVMTPNMPAVDNVYKYIRENNGAIPPWRINERISWAEMIGHDNTAQERYSELTQDKLINCVGIADKLLNFLNSTKLKGQKILISSGWRSKRNNAKAGGKQESVHLRGGAIDFRFMNIDTRQAFEEVFVGNWTGFTYRFVAKSGRSYIHVQSTYGVGGAKTQRTVIQ